MELLDKVNDVCTELSEVESVTADYVQQADECLGKVSDLMLDIGKDVQHENNMVTSLFLFRSSSNKSWAP